MSFTTRVDGPDKGRYRKQYDSGCLAECQNVFRAEYNRMTSLRKSLGEEKYGKYFVRYLSNGTDAMGRAHLLMEDAGGETLRSYLSRQAPPREGRRLLTGSFTKELFRLLLESESYLQKEGLVQLDISPGNIVLLLDEAGSLLGIRLLDMTGCYDLSTGLGIGGGVARQISDRVPAFTPIDIRLRDSCAALFGLLFFDRETDFSLQEIPEPYRSYASIPKGVPDGGNRDVPLLAAMSEWINEMARTLDGYY